MNEDDLTFEERSKLLEAEPTIRDVKKAFARYLPEPVKVKPFCGNCGSIFLSTDAEWYKIVTGREGRNYWQVRYSNMMVEHLAGFTLVQIYRRFMQMVN